MKILGIIAEYNPFHSGHKYHIQKSKELYNCDYTIAIMSGSFVQRGEPALIDKFSRAKAALLNGIDLVIELPFIYSAQTAEIFAGGAINILDSLNCVDYLSFGSELDDIDSLLTISTILQKEPEDYKKILKLYLQKGISFPKARTLALEEYLKLENNNLYKEINSILNGSNNILAIEYIKSIIDLKSNIKPVLVKRYGNKYSDTDFGDTFSSATSIRKHLAQDNFEPTLDFLPESSYETIDIFHKKYQTFNSLDKYYNFFNFKLTTENQPVIKDIFDIGDDLGNRFLNNFYKYDNINDFVDNISSKNYTRTRIQRSIINIITNNTIANQKNLSNYANKYIRVLASNTKGFEIINKIKKESNVIILNKFADHANFKKLNQIVTFEKKITDLYYLGLLKKPLINMDYKTSPYIKK